MEGLLILLILLIVVAPITLSIVAMVKVSSLKRDVRALQSQWNHPQAAPKPVVQAKTAAVLPPPLPKPPPGPPSPPVPDRPVAPERPEARMEFFMGGKAAAFAGIAILVVGIALLVGYAIQHSWIGPGTRIVLGLLAGGVLVGGGHFVERRDAKLKLFARVLTGGGSALFYFSVFAAYGVYHLIGVSLAGVGLVASALAVFGLAMAYRSQSVGVLGVLGAFITPLLIGGDMDSGAFPLAYVAVVNVPVILLGIRRKWQVLYNLAFVFTVLHSVAWLDWVGQSEWWIGLGFAILFFTEYAALGLLKLRCEQQITGRTADLIRLVAASLLLLGGIYWLFDDAGINQWIGTAFLAMALLHVGLARFAFTVLRRFNGEILAFLAGGLAFATLALPAQLDGEWVSLGWAIEGVVLAWFATRVQSRALLVGAFFLGLVGILKSLAFDVTLYPSAPALILNARFAVGMLSAILLGVQGWLANRFPSEKGTSRWQDMLWWIGVLGAITVFFADTFWTLGTEEASSWLITSLMLLATGAALLLFAPPTSSVIKLGSLLLLLVPFKLLMVDAWLGLDVGGYGLKPFCNAIIWVQLLMIGLVVCLLTPRISQKKGAVILPISTYARTLNISSLAAGIGIVTLEILRKNSDWADTGVTILWAICALLLILFGMKRHSAAHRYFGLVLFGLTTLKVVLIDSSELQGLERIAAFIGTGLLLLVLSFAYQKASAYFHAQGENE